MATRTYYCGALGRVKRLTNLTGAWADVSITSVVPGFVFNLYDIKSDPNDTDKVFVVGDSDKSRSFNGIAVSSNAGSTWVIPTGGYSVARKFNEVWPIDSNNIVAIGDGGIVAYSSDAGATFALAGYATPSGGYGAGQGYSIHFITPLIGVATFESYVLKTVDGGVTWTVLNGGTAFNIAAVPALCTGVYISNDQQTIVVHTVKGIFLSVNGGSSFTLTHTWASNEGLHLSWFPRYDATNFWATGRGGARVTASNPSTWNMLNPTSPSLLPAIYAAHFYTASNGFYSEDGELLRTSNSGISGLTSDSVNEPIFAVWTAPAICSCPPGYTLSPDGTECIQTLYADVEQQPTSYTVAAGDKLSSYGNLGAAFYDDATGRPLPIAAFTGPNRLQDAAAVQLNVVNTVVNSLWGNGTLAGGRLNNAGVWTSLGGGLPTGQWIGFSACVDIQEAGVYCVGIAGDNRVRFKVNGQVMVEIDINNTFPFNYWHVIPFTLNAGLNIIELEGKNDGNQAAFAAEIYQATTAQLASMTTTAELSAVTIFSTYDKIGDSFETGETSGYTCPEGYSLSTCDEELSCVLINRIPFEPCCYILRDCQGEREDIITDTNLSLYVGQIIRINGYTECWQVLNADTCDAAVSVTMTGQVYDTCDACLPVCYTLTDCKGVKDSITVSTDLSSYVGRIIQVVGDDTCWMVGLTNYCDCVYTVIVNRQYAECKDCPPKELSPLYEPYIEPGSNIIHCDPDEVIEANNDFANSVYKAIAKKKYGINICCDQDDVEISMRKELMDFALMYNPTLCGVETDTCCPEPCNVTAVLNVFTPTGCPAPENASAIITV
jgi:hypothetical protein